MVNSCVAFGCKNRATPEAIANRVHFHLFPKEEERKNQWIQSIKRANFQPTKYSRLCSDHFGIEDYYVQNDGRFCLNSDAIPSVFENFPNHLQKSLKPKRKLPACALK